MPTPKPTIAIAVTALGLAGCSAAVSTEEVDQRAGTAGEVMTRGSDPDPGPLAAARVTGTRNRVTINALEATKWPVRASGWKPADTCVSGTTRPGAMRPTSSGAGCQA